MKIDLDAIPASESCSAAEKLFSETNGRFIATVSPAKAAAFEAALAGCTFARIGKVTGTDTLVFTGSETGKVSIALDELVTSYKTTLDRV